MRSRAAVEPQVVPHRPELIVRLMPGSVDIEWRGIDEGPSSEGGMFLVSSSGQDIVLTIETSHDLIPG